MNISEFSTSPGASLTETDLCRLASFGFEITFSGADTEAIISRVLMRLAEMSPENPKHWSRDEILVWLNDAITEFNLIAGYLTKTVTVSWSQTENVLNLPNDTIVPLEVYYNDNIIKKYTIEGLDSKLVWDDGSTGLVPKAWCPFGSQKIVVYPLSQKSTQSLSVVTLYQPSTLTGPASIEVVHQYFDAIEHYMYARARFKEGGAEFQQADIDYDRFFEQAVEWKTRVSQQRRTTWKTRIKAITSHIRLKDVDEAQ
jgi:hypothetical protein